MNNLREKRVVSESVEEMSVIDQDSELLVARVFTNTVYIVRSVALQRKWMMGRKVKTTRRKAKRG